MAWLTLRLGPLASLLEHALNLAIERVSGAGHRHGRVDAAGGALFVHFRHERFQSAQFAVWPAAL